MSWRKFLAIPQLVYYGVRAPRRQSLAWDRFWSGISKTGMGGDVLWDAASDVELSALREKALAHLDRGLPVLDIGSGNGRQARVFAAHWPSVVGVDVSPAAVARAKEESRGIDNLELHVVDASVPGALRALLEGRGDMNVHVRGVFHVLDEAGRKALAENIRGVLGQRGTLYLFETNLEGDPLDHLEFQGATLTSMPDPLRRCIAAGIRPPVHFGDAQVKASFPSSQWEVLESGKTVAHGVPLFPGREVEEIPSFFAVIRPRVKGRG